MVSRRAQLCSLHLADGNFVGNEILHYFLLLVAVLPALRLLGFRVLRLLHQDPGSISLAYLTSS